MVPIHVQSTYERVCELQDLVEGVAFRVRDPGMPRPLYAQLAFLIHLPSPVVMPEVR